MMVHPYNPQGMPRGESGEVMMGSSASLEGGALVAGVHTPPYMVITPELGELSGMGGGGMMGHYPPPMMMAHPSEEMLASSENVTPAPVLVDPSVPYPVSPLLAGYHPGGGSPVFTATNVAFGSPQGVRHRARSGTPHNQG